MMRAFVLLTLFTLMVFAGWNVTHQPRSLEMSSVTGPRPFDYESLKELVETRKPKSIDEVIPLLPLNLRDNVTFIFASKSIQQASVSRPRALLFGDDAKLIITFGGDPSLPGFNSLEIMQYRDSGSRYEMHEIKFDGENPRFASSGEMSAKCTTCHGADPHPIWTAYNTWTGAFGENDDDINQMALNSGTSFNQFESFKALKNDPELAPRYRAIFANHDLPWPYYDSSDKKVYQRGLFRMPNDRFAYLASLTRARQLARVISESSLSKTMRYSFLYVSLCEFYTPSESKPRSPETIAFFQGIRNEMAQRCEIPEGEHWQGTRAQWLASNGGYPKDFVNFYGVPNGDSSNDLKPGQYGSTSNGIPLGIGSYEETARGLANNYLLQKQMSQDAVLAEIGRRNRISFPSPSSFKGHDAVTYVAPEGFSREVRRQPYFNGPGVQKAACGYLKQKSLQELAVLKRQGRGTQGAEGVFDSPTVALQLQQGRELLSTSGCISCHDQNGDLQLGPEIDFSDPVAFAAQNARTRIQTGESLIAAVKDRISKSAYGKRRMPVSGRDLTPQEQNALVLYLESVVSQDR